MRYSLNDLHNYAKLKEGKCHSKKYYRSDTVYLWECKFGHKWSAMWNNINRGRWCNKCHHKNLSFDFSIIKKKVESFGGQLITKEGEYVNNKSPLKYTCSRRHEVISDWSRLQQAKKNTKGNIERWCTACSGKKKYTIKDIQKIAKNKGGELISDIYKSNKDLLSWRCKDGHEFSMNLHNILTGDQWCRYCSIGKAEKKVRDLFEYIFQSKFPTAHPEWLKNPQGRKLELDGYNKKLKIAFEFQGVQHYEYDPDFFHKGGIHEFYRQQENDKFKKKRCQEMDIALICVSYKLDHDIFEYIISECEKKNIKVKRTQKID